MVKLVKLRDPVPRPREYGTGELSLATVLAVLLNDGRGEGAGSDVEELSLFRLNQIRGTTHTTLEHKG